MPMTYLIRLAHMADESMLPTPLPGPSVPTSVLAKLSGAEIERGILDGQAGSKTLLLLRHIVDVATTTLVR